MLETTFFDLLFDLCARGGWLGGPSAAADLQVRSVAGCGHWQCRTWHALEHALWCTFRQQRYVQYVCPGHIPISLKDFAFCACEVGLAGVFSGVVCICVQPQCQRCPMEELVHREPGLGPGSDGKRYSNK